MLDWQALKDSLIFVLECVGRPTATTGAAAAVRERPRSCGRGYDGVLSATAFRELCVLGAQQMGQADPP
jgi:hypothetical protein